MTDTIEAAPLSAPECLEAEKEAIEAAGLVSALEARVLDGDTTVTAAKLASTRDLASFAKLRLEAARRKALRAHEKHRMAELRRLREEIDAYTATSGADYVQLLTAVTDAAAAFRAAVDERNERVTAWRTRAEQLGAPTTGLVGPGDDDGTVTVGAAWGEVIAGQRSLRTIDADLWLVDALGAQRGPSFGTQIVFGDSRANLEALADIDGAPS